MIIPREYLETHIINMKNHMDRRLAELVFNIDEAGFSD
jgi:hypothetical protein